MSASLIDVWNDQLQDHGPGAAFERVEQNVREERNYPLLFELLLLKNRWELGLPLTSREGPVASSALAKPYEEGMMTAARTVGQLFLQDGQITRAYPYCRACGDVALVSEALERVQPDADSEELDTLIGIGLHEGVNPRKAFELVLSRYGICRSISFYQQYPEHPSRRLSLQLLVRTLHQELIASLRRAIERAEGSAPSASSAPELMAGRSWLFGEYDYYVDTSHLVSVLKFSLDLDDPQHLLLAEELAEYGKNLASPFHYTGDPPFEKYEDHAIYLRALRGQETDRAAEHFRTKAEGADPAEIGTAPAQFYVMLLARLRRYAEAAEAHARLLRSVPSSELACPTLAELCTLAGNYSRLLEWSREDGDLVNFAAASLALARPQLVGSSQAGQD